MATACCVYLFNPAWADESPNVSVNVVAPASVVRNYRQWLVRHPFISAVSTNEAQTTPSRGAEHDSNHNNFLNLLHNNSQPDKNADSITITPPDFSGVRDTAEMWLLHWLLNRCGVSISDYVTEDNYSRILHLLQQGEAHVSGTTVWRDDVIKLADVGLTPAIIAEGDYMVGLYGLASRDELFKLQAGQSLAKYRVVSNKHWWRDWKVLNSMGFAEVMHASSSRYMVRMVVAGRADFLLAQFPNAEGMSSEDSVERLRFIPGVKVVLPGSRHYAWGRSMKSEVRACVASEMSTHEVQTIISRLLESSGMVYSPALDWPTINQLQ